MSELEEKLNSILNDPRAMGQIMALAKSLGGTAAPSDSGGPLEAPPTPPPAAAERGGTQPVPDLSALLGAVTGNGDSGPDPRLLALASRVMAEYGRNDEKKTALLTALRPYVKEKRYARLDKAVQIARLSRLIRVGLEVFRGEEYV